MSVIRPKIFISYRTLDGAKVDRIERDLRQSGVESWRDNQLEPGDRLKRVIFEHAIPECCLFFAYITKEYLGSEWCMNELREAIAATGVAVAPFVDSASTLDLIPKALRDEVRFELMTDETYWDSILALSGKAWASLQAVQRLVPSENHILTGPEIFKSPGFRRADLLRRVRKELVLAAPNLRSWLSDPDSRLGLVDLVRQRRVRVSLIMATYESMRPLAEEGAQHLRQSALDIRQMLGLLDPAERTLMRAHFHVAATTLSAVFVDPEEDDGILFFNPRWAIQFLPQERLTCVIDKTINPPSLYNAIFNSVLLMTQSDALTIDDMLREPIPGL